MAIFMQFLRQIPPFFAIREQISRFGSKFLGSGANFSIREQFSRFGSKFHYSGANFTIREQIPRSVSKFPDPGANSSIREYVRVFCRLGVACTALLKPSYLVTASRSATGSISSLALRSASSDLSAALASLPIAEKGEGSKPASTPIKPRQARMTA